MMSEASYFIGIDLGGTEIKTVAVTYPGGDSLGKATLPTMDGEWEDDQPRFANQVALLIAQHEETIGRKATGIGLSAPGLPGQNGDCIGFMPGRMDGLEGLVWADTLGTDHPVPVVNDAQAALLGEIWLGAARGLEDVVLFTLGTGVGGAIVSGGRLLKGRFRRAGHLGHMTVDFRGEPDFCKTPGSIEDAVGNFTVSKRSGGRYHSTAELVKAHAQGDPVATEVWLDSLRALAAAMVSITNAVDPEVIVVAGGLTAAGDYLFEPLAKFVAEREWTPADARVELRPAELGTWSGAYGAAHQAATQHESTTSKHV